MSKLVRFVGYGIVFAFIAFGCFASWSVDRRISRLTRECANRGGVFASELNACFDPKALK